MNQISQSTLSTSNLKEKHSSFITTEQTNEILKEVCPLHDIFCDLIHLSKNSKNNRVCVECMQEQGIDIKQVLSLKRLFTSTSKSFLLNFPAFSDTFLISKVKKIEGSVQELSDKIDIYFQNLKNDFCQAIEKAQANSKIDLAILMNSYSIILDSFKEVNRIEDLQQAVASQSSETLHNFILDHCKKSEQKEKSINDYYEVFDTQRQSFSMDMPRRFLQIIKEQIEELRFFSLQQIIERGPICSSLSQQQLSSNLSSDLSFEHSSPLEIDSKIYFSDGTLYEGQSKQSIPHGKGRMVYPNGDILECGFENGQAQGYGKLSLFYGDIFQGEYKDNKWNGKGIRYYANGNRYEGEFQDNRMEGYGKYFFSNGDMYEGQYKDNKWNGKGKKIYSNGSTFNGEFKDGKRHGQGVCKNSKGSILREGIWKEGEIESEKYQE